MQTVSASGQWMVLQLHLLSTWVKRQELLVAASRQHCKKINNSDKTKDQMHRSDWVARERKGSNGKKVEKKRILPKS